MSRLRALIRSSAALWAILVCACLPMGDRVAGSSTEAGNAGGKLSLTDGTPAADVSVALVARSYLPDTLANGGVAGTGMNRAGSYYRTRTGADGRFNFTGVAPGAYRVMAIGKGAGVMADSVFVDAGGDTALDEVMKPLGGIRGVAKIVGTEETVNVWVSPKATLKDPSQADPAGGAFHLDSLPEGEYELIPECFTCQPVKEGYRVQVKAGKDTVLADTLKVYPEYFYDFPDSGNLDVQSSWLPLSIKGKVHRAEDSNGVPGAISWDWNGTPLTGQSVQMPDGISETGTVLDSTLFDGASSGILRLVLAYPDTNITREWHVTLDMAGRIWPLSAVRLDSAIKVSGALPHMWRFHVAESLPLDYADVAFWGIQPGTPANQASLPEWLDLAVEDTVAAALNAGNPSRMSFILVPDAKLGGRVVRPRWDESLSDFGEIHFLERAHFGFPDALEPSMLPGGLIVDRHRGPYILQRYRVDSLGGVEELLGSLPYQDPKPSATVPEESPVLFYRQGSAADGFSWDKPLRDAAKALAVTREGLAVRLDGSGFTMMLSAGEFAALKDLLAPLSLDPPALPDTGMPGLGGNLEYIRGGKRGLLRSTGLPGSESPADSLLTALHAWMLRNGLEESARFPLAGPAWRYLGFTEDSSGLRYTGDTLVAELSDSGGSVSVREFLSENSPGRLSDSSVIEYGLKVGRDTLLAVSESLLVTSRLFGKIYGETPVFALTGLKPVSPSLENGIPILTGNGNTLSGRMSGALEINGRSVIAADLWLDGREIAQGRQGSGFLYTPEEGLLRTWRFNGSNGKVKGWDKL